RAARPARVRRQRRRRHRRAVSRLRCPLAAGCGRTAGASAGALTGVAARARRPRLWFNSRIVEPSSLRPAPPVSKSLYASAERCLDCADVAEKLALTDAVAREFACG